MEILALIVIVYAVKAAVDDARKGWRTSKSAYMRSAAARFPGAPGARRTAQALRHDIGYWAAETARVFPSARHGFAAGWHSGRQEQAQRKAAREEAKARHLEARADAVPQVSAFRRRQEKARERIREAGRPAPATVPGTAGEGSAEGSEGSRAAEQGTRPGPQSPPPPDGGGRTYSYGAAGMPYHWPVGADAEKARHWAQRMSEGGRPYTVTAYPSGGGPGVPAATYLNGREIQPTAGQRSAWDAEADEWRRQYGQQGQSPAPDAAGGTVLPSGGRVLRAGEMEVRDGQVTVRGWEFASHPDLPAGALGTAALSRADIAAMHNLAHGPGCACEVSRIVPSRASTPKSPTEGETMAAAAADVTYNGILRNMAAAKADAEGKAAESATASRQAEARAGEADSASRAAADVADQMQALEVDPGTLSAMADHLDARDAAAKAHQAVQEAAEAAVKADRRVLETAGTVETVMQRGHAGLNAAHQEAPVTAADKTFYGEG